jgi:hypothetical protein
MTNIQSISISSALIIASDFWLVKVLKFKGKKSISKTRKVRISGGPQEAEGNRMASFMQLQFWRPFWKRENVAQGGPLRPMGIKYE